MNVAIVGAGPVGMFLALKLNALGVQTRVFERRSDLRPGSRSIGIHPPSIELLDELGLGDQFLARGVRISRGLAFSNGRFLGHLDFNECAGRHRYVLGIPQWQTEAILREAIDARMPGAIVSGAEVREVSADRGVVLVADANDERMEAFDFVVACDGRHSRVRTALGITFDGARYPGEYVMGDVDDETDLGDRAAIFLGEEGLVESFPLPGGQRRWVARRTIDGDSSADELAGIVEVRTGHVIASDRITALSSFCAERWLASRLAFRRVALAGDAAHVVSPIGGQGMNLGWLGAASLARALCTGDANAVEADAARRRRMAGAASRRAELNMWLGRGSHERLIRTLLHRPFSTGLARIFTMRGLSWGT